MIRFYLFDPQHANKQSPFKIFHSKKTMKNASVCMHVGAVVLSGNSYIRIPLILSHVLSHILLSSKMVSVRITAFACPRLLTLLQKRPKRCRSLADSSTDSSLT